MRVDEARNGWSLVAIKMNARTYVGRGEVSLPAINMCYAIPGLSKDCCVFRRERESKGKGIKWGREEKNGER